MNLWRISAVEHHPLDLRAAHPNGRAPLGRRGSRAASPFAAGQAQTPVVNPIVETHRAFGCLRFKIRSRSPICRGIAVTLHGPASDRKWASDVDHSNE